MNLSFFICLSDGGVSALKSIEIRTVCWFHWVLCICQIYIIHIWPIQITFSLEEIDPQWSWLPWKNSHYFKSNTVFTALRAWSPLYKITTKYLVLLRSIHSLALVYRSMYCMEWKPASIYHNILFNKNCKYSKAGVRKLFFTPTDVPFA